MQQAMLLTSSEWLEQQTRGDTTIIVTSTPPSNARIIDSGARKAEYMFHEDPQASTEMPHGSTRV